jgi:hypothetical protein
MEDEINAIWKEKLNLNTITELLRRENKTTKTLSQVEN